MPSARFFSIPFLAVLFLSAGCGVLGSSTDDSSKGESIASAQDLVMHLGRQGYILRPTHLTSPFALADVGHEYTVEGGRIRIYEFESLDEAERAVEEFLLDNSGGGTGTVFQRGSMMVAYAGGSPSLQVTLAHTLGPAAY